MFSLLHVGLVNQRILKITTTSKDATSSISRVLGDRTKIVRGQTIHSARARPLLGYYGSTRDSIDRVRKVFLNGTLQSILG